jgi:hypothetical protein
MEINIGACPNANNNKRNNWWRITRKQEGLNPMETQCMVCLQFPFLFSVVLTLISPEWMNETLQRIGFSYKQEKWDIMCV